MSMKNFLLWLTFFGLVMTGVSAADAQQNNCGGLVPTLQDLEKTYGETPLFSTSSKTSGWPLIMTVNPSKGTYTVLGVKPGGEIVCVLDAGDKFEPWVGRVTPQEPKAAPKLKPTDGGRES